VGQGHEDRRDPSGGLMAAMHATSPGYSSAEAVRRLIKAAFVRRLSPPVAPPFSAMPMWCPIYPALQRAPRRSASRRYAASCDSGRRGRAAPHSASRQGGREVLEAAPSAGRRGSCRRFPFRFAPQDKANCGGRWAGGTHIMPVTDSRITSALFYNLLHFIFYY
jgi:hypothetical protein